MLVEIKDFWVLRRFSHAVCINVFKFAQYNLTFYFFKYFYHWKIVVVDSALNFAEFQPSIL